MAAQANMFDELSSRISKRQPLQQVSTDTPVISSSPAQVKRGPGHPPPPPAKPHVPSAKPERKGSVPVSRSNAARVEVQQARDGDSPRELDQADAPHSAKKGGFLKNLKKMFKRKKKGKSHADENELAGQYKAQSEPELLSTKGPVHDNSEHRVRLNTTDTELADVSLSAEGNHVSVPLHTSGHPDAAFSSDEEAGSRSELQEKGRSSFRKFNFSKKRNSKNGDGTLNLEVASQSEHVSAKKASPAPVPPKPNIPKRPSDVGSAAYALEDGDEFFTASLTKTDDHDVRPSESISFDALAVVHSYGDDRNVIAKDRIRVAPKDRRKPAKFQQLVSPRGNTEEEVEFKSVNVDLDDVDIGRKRLSADIPASNHRHSRGSDEALARLSHDKLHRSSSRDKFPPTPSQETVVRTSSQGAHDRMLRGSSHEQVGKPASLEDVRAKKHRDSSGSSDRSRPISKKRGSKSSRASDSLLTSSSENVHRTSSESDGVSSGSTSSLTKKVLGFFEGKRPLSLSLGVLPKMHEEVDIASVDASKKTKSVGNLAVNDSIKFVGTGKSDFSDQVKGVLPHRRSAVDLVPTPSADRTGKEASFERHSLADLADLRSNDNNTDSETVSGPLSKVVLLGDGKEYGAEKKKKAAGQADLWSESFPEFNVSLVPSVQKSAPEEGNRVKGFAVEERHPMSSSSSSKARIKSKPAVVADSHSDADPDLSHAVATGIVPQRSASEHANRFKQPAVEDRLPRPASELYAKHAAINDHSVQPGVPLESRGKALVLKKTELDKVDLSSNSEEHTTSVEKRTLKMPFAQEQSLENSKIMNEPSMVADANVSIDDLRKRFDHPQPNTDTGDLSRYRSLSEAKPRPHAQAKPARSFTAKDSDFATVTQSADLEEESELATPRSYSLSSPGTVLPSSLRKPLTPIYRNREEPVSPTKDTTQAEPDWIAMARTKQNSFDDSEDDQTNIRPSSLKRRTSSGATRNDNTSTEKCIVCGKTAYLFERCDVDNKILHKTCAKCAVCSRTLAVGTVHIYDGTVYCGQHKR